MIHNEQPSSRNQAPSLMIREMTFGTDRSDPAFDYGITVEERQKLSILIEDREKEYDSPIKEQYRSANTNGSW